MSQILSQLWARLQKYHSIQESHSSWQPSTSYSCYTVTLNLMKYYRQIFLSDRSVMVCLQNPYIMVLLNLILSFRKANAWELLSVEPIRWLLLITETQRTCLISSNFGHLLYTWSDLFGLLFVSPV